MLHHCTIEIAKIDFYFSSNRMTIRKKIKAFDGELAPPQFCKAVTSCSLDIKVNSSWLISNSPREGVVGGNL